MDTIKNLNRLFVIFIFITSLSAVCLGQQISKVIAPSKPSVPTQGFLKKDIPVTNLRISFVGSSVTWSDGFLQSGLVNETNLNTQKRRSDVIGAKDIAVTGPHQLLDSQGDRKFFDDTALKISGMN